MALVRILIDGYSLLHGWPALVPNAARHSHQARGALLTRLTRYRDATLVPITVFFDGQGAPGGTPKLASSHDMEVLFSRAGQTADDMIERTAYRIKAYGEVLVVTDDRAERDTVVNMGGLATSCSSFIAQVEAALAEMTFDLKHHNRREDQRFRQS